MMQSNIREKSIVIVRNMGLEPNEKLPYLDVSLELRTKDEVVFRALCLNGLLAASCGFNKSKTIEWLKRENIYEYLSLKEKLFFESDIGDVSVIKSQVEGLWMLVWALSFFNKMDFGNICGGNLVYMLPKLNIMENYVGFYKAAKLRSHIEVLEALDISYLLHSALIQAELDGVKTPDRIKYYVIYERRRALEWLVSNEDWDEVNLDT